MGNILGILDLKDPEKPEYTALWWVPGQWVGGGEEPLPEGRRVRCHHPFRLGNRLYSGWWHHGWYIHDVFSKPKPIVHVDWSPPFPCPTHTAMPLPYTIKGRQILIVNDEEVSDRLAPTPNAFLWIVDVTEETNPVPIATYRARKDDEPYDPKFWYGCHQPQEQIYGEQTRFAVTWFGGGLRMIDISDPWSVEELGLLHPRTRQGVRPPRATTCSRTSTASTTSSTETAGSTFSSGPGAKRLSPRPGTARRWRPEWRGVRRSSGSGEAARPRRARARDSR